MLHGNNKYIYYIIKIIDTRLFHSVIISIWVDVYKQIG